MNKKRFRTDFEDALKVMWAFNDVMSAGPSKRRESDLPYGKGRIKNALVFINAAIHTDETLAAIAEVFPAKAAELYLSEQFGGAMMSHLLHLAEFLGDEESALSDRVHRRLGRKIGPDGLYLPQSEAAAWDCIEQMRNDPAASGELERWVEIQARVSQEGNAYLEEAKAFKLF